jgi:hypothetical protein
VKVRGRSRDKPQTSPRLSHCRPKLIRRRDPIRLFTLLFPMNDMQHPQKETSRGEDVGAREGATKLESPSQVGKVAVQCPPVCRDSDDVETFALALPSVSCEGPCRPLTHPDHPRMGRLALAEVQASTPDPRLDFPK